MIQWLRNTFRFDPVWIFQPRDHALINHIIQADRAATDLKYSRYPIDALSIAKTCERFDVGLVDLNMGWFRSYGHPLLPMRESDLEPLGFKVIIKIIDLYVNSDYNS